MKYDVQCSKFILEQHRKEFRTSYTAHRTFVKLI